MQQKASIQGKGPVIKEALRAGVNTALVVGALALPVMSEPVKAQDFMTLNASSYFATRYVGSAGFFLSKGAVNQTEFDLNFGDHVMASTWINTDFGYGKVTEQDFYLTYTEKKLLSIDDPTFKGTISGSISFQDYHFPYGILASSDTYAMNGKISYTGLFNASVTVYQLLNKTQGEAVIFSLSKQFDIGNIGNTKVSFGPTLSYAYDSNFLGANGSAYITPGMSLQFKHDNLNFELFAKDQLTLNPNTIPEGVFAGVGVNITDLPSVFRK